MYTGQCGFGGWGNDPDKMTNDSNISALVVFFGWVGEGQQACVVVTQLGNDSGYGSGSQNCVYTNSWGSWARMSLTYYAGYT